MDATTITTPFSEAELIADLRATYPALFVRPLREFGCDYADTNGVWTGGECDMPDGLPIFSYFCGPSEEYDGDVHDAFNQWLENRGWYLENYDGQARFIVSIAEAKDFWANLPPIAAPDATFNPNECPF